MNLQTLLGIELPIIQAPMAGVQDSALAVAVSNAGGLGSLPCAMLAPAAMRRELEKLHARTDRPYSLNFFCHTPARPDARREAAWRQALQPFHAEFGIDPDTITDGPARVPFDEDAADLLAEFVPPVLSFHFGLPAPALLARVRAWGAKIISSATTVEEALWLESRGVDLIVAQGVDAGGHRGMFLDTDLSAQADTMTLLPQIVRAVRVPVVAAGGIADARGVAAAMALGAVGAQLGTAYLLCPEASTSALHRAALQGDWCERHRVDQPVHRPAGARHRQPLHARDGADESARAGLPLGGGRRGAVARQGRSPRQRRLLAAVGRDKHERLPRHAGRAADPRAGRDLSARARAAAMPPRRRRRPIHGIVAPPHVMKGLR